MICMQDMNMLLSYEYVEWEQIFASVVCICHTRLAFCMLLVGKSRVGQ